MSKSSRKRAPKNYRERLKQRGVSRFEVVGPSADRELIRALAKRLASDGPEAHRIRAAARNAIASEPGQKGGILRALRRSPLVGADLELAKKQVFERRVCTVSAFGFSLLRVTGSLNLISAVQTAGD